MTRGAFLSFDGLDGTGKSTQCRLLVEWLRSSGKTVTTCVEPGGTELGQKIRDLLLFGKQNLMGTRAEMLLFMASRAELVERVIMPALDRGEIVVADRFLLASVVYQGHAGGLSIRDLWDVGRVATQGVEPDLTLIFDLPADLAAKRRGRAADRMESKGSEYFERVRQGFLREAAADPVRRVLIDAMPDVITTHETVRTIVSKFLNARGDSLSGSAP
ncbi:MAG: dTMP kinase [Gemmataceae bacterium]